MDVDWKTAVLLPSTENHAVYTCLRLEYCRIITSFYCRRIHWRQTLIGRLPYYYFLLLLRGASGSGEDWKTAVLLLPSTKPLKQEGHPLIGILPYLYFLLLKLVEEQNPLDWNTAVLLLPSTP